MPRFRTWNVTRNIEDLADYGEPVEYDVPAYSETVWPYDYRRSYVPSRPAYESYSESHVQSQHRPRRYEVEEYMSTWEPRRYENISDEEIRNRIYDRLDHDYRVPDNAEIQVSVMNGVVTLTGTCRNRTVKQLIGQHAWQQPGVEDVHNNVNITGRWSQRTNT